MEALVLEATVCLGLPTVPSCFPPTPYSLLQRLLRCMETDPWVAQQCGVTAPNYEDAAMNGQLRAVAELLTVGLVGYWALKLSDVVIVVFGRFR